MASLGAQPREDDLRRALRVTICAPNGFTFSCLEETASPFVPLVGGASCCLPSAEGDVVATRIAAARWVAFGSGERFILKRPRLPWEN